MASLKAPLFVELYGFSMADEAAPIISLLGRGVGFRQFVTNDVEKELYDQTPGAQLLSILCKAAPKLETTGMHSMPENIVIVKDVSITFSLKLSIVIYEDILWELDVNHNYISSNVNLSNNGRKIIQNFSIIQSRRV